LVFPKHIAALMEEFFLEPKNGSKPNRWNVVPNIAYDSI
jgi:hypothetical protein